MFAWKIRARDGGFLPSPWGFFGTSRRSKGIILLTNNRSLDELKAAAKEQGMPEEEIDQVTAVGQVRNNMGWVEKKQYEELRQRCNDSYREKDQLQREKAELQRKIEQLTAQIAASTKPKKSKG